MMKTGLIGGAGILCGGLYVSGAFSPGEVYDKPVAEVRRTVENVPVRMEMDGIFSKSSGRTVQVSTVTAPDGSVVWRFTEGGHELQVVRASISAEGVDRTRVSIDATPGDALEKRIPEAAKRSAAT
jgi:hypothetical protein